MVSNTGGEILYETIESLNPRVIFHLPGLHTLHIYDAMYGKHGIRSIMVKHEGNGAVMADTFGRLTGDPGIILVTSGPGATNSATGVAQAYNASSPLLHISSTVPAAEPSGSLHGVDDPDFLRKIFAPITKWSTRVTNIEDLPNTILKAYNLAKTPRKGPVHVEVPYDVLAGKGKMPKLELLSVQERTPNKRSIKLAAELIIESNSPVIYAGKGVARGSSSYALIDFAESLGAPVLANSNNPEVFPNDHELYAGTVSQWSVDPPAEVALEFADLLLTVGVHWGSIETIPLKNLKKLCIRIDDTEGFDENMPRPVVSLIGDTKTILEELLKMVRESGAGVAKRHVIERIRKTRAKVQEIVNSELAIHRDSKPIYPGLLASELRNLISDDAIVTLDGGTTTSWFMKIYKNRSPNTLIWPGGYGSMGFAFPAGLAAKVIHPDRDVVAVTGDGGFLMSLMDIPTALENNLNFVVVVANDSKYTSIWTLQRLNFQGRYMATDLTPVNYAALAESFGARGIRVEEPSLVKHAYEQALSSKILTVVDVVTDFRHTLPR